MKYLMNTCDINTWGNFTSWELVSAPSRPDLWQLENIREILKDVPTSADIAVLGSTIEFRNLLAELNYNNIFVFERNQSFYEYISQYKSFDYKETLVLGNWLDTLFDYPDRFAVILSDLTSGNVSYSSRNQFYHGISGALLTRGYFVDRILTKPCPLIPIHSLIKKYSDLIVTNETVNSFNCEVMFCSTLLDNDDKIVDTSTFYDILLDLQIPRISEFVRACYNITPRECVWWYSKPWSQEQKVYETYLRILKAYDEPQTSEYANRCKFLVSCRKGYNCESS